MAFYSEHYAVQFFGIVLAIIVSAYVYLKHVAFNYWSSRNVKYIEPVFPVGSLWPVLSEKTSLGEFLRDTYLIHRKSPIYGFYTFHRPMLVVNDPDLIRVVLTKEFSHFHDRGLGCNEKGDPLASNLFLLPGSRWKFLRAKFSPTFTSSKMRQMFFTVKECAETLTTYVANIAKDSELVEVKDLMARFSTDVIASTAFGIQCNSIENPNADFRKYGRRVFIPRPLQNALSILFPSISVFLNFQCVDKDIADFFINTFKETVEYRTANNIARKDFLDLVMQLINTGHLQDNDQKDSEPVAEDHSGKISLMEGAAQAFLFWLAGFETSSSTATYCLYELALNQDIQDKVADEINTVLKESGGVTYESLKKMTYLHKVISETLRKYPSLPFLNRECTKDFTLPGTDFCVKKGTAILIPVLGLHSDPDLYPNPEKFDPERFTEENIANRHQYSYLAFGEGPRNCIGMRFGLVQTKISLLSLLSKYRFKPGPNLKVPLELDKGNFVLGVKGGVTLRVEMR